MQNRQIYSEGMSLALPFEMVLICGTRLVAQKEMKERAENKKTLSENAKIH